MNSKQRRVARRAAGRQTETLAHEIRDLYAEEVRRGDPVIFLLLDGADPTDGSDRASVIAPA